MTNIEKAFPELVDLRTYLLPEARDMVRELYKLYRWDFEPQDAWTWKFADVCALYFRVLRHRDYFGPLLDSRQLLTALEAAISDYQADEFS